MSDERDPAMNSDPRSSTSSSSYSDPAQGPNPQISGGDQVDRRRSRSHTPSVKRSKNKSSTQSSKDDTTIPTWRNVPKPEAREVNIPPKQHIKVE